jgi:uncharacterized protein YjlB
MDRLFIIKHFLSADKNFPNNDALPLLIYKNALTLEGTEEQNAVCVEKLFRKNDWHPSWRDGIHDFQHYHSTAHEALGIYSGHAKVQFGGPQGVIVEVACGDVIIIPAGVAHKSIHCSEDFQCVGAYPTGQEYDIMYGEENERIEAEDNIQHVPLTSHDPVFGKQGPLEKWWFIHEKLKVTNQQLASNSNQVTSNSNFRAAI